jgi:formylglycine-generating enzyme required for sulfatase activity
MKRILGILLVLLCATTLITGCSKGKEPQAKDELASVKVASAPKEKPTIEKVGFAIQKTDKAREPDAKNVIDLSNNKLTITLKKGVKKIELDMVLVQAGKFNMGDTEKELEQFKERLKAEFKEALKKNLNNTTLGIINTIVSLQGKQHEVTLTKPFYMGKYEVTQEQWEAVMGNNPSKTKGDKLPVTDVSWEYCQDFIKKLNEKTGGECRLPTEAEWEYACRAGTTTAYSFGDKITPKDGNYRDSKIGEPVAVGSYKPNAFGLYDMHGNVSEWCEDWYGEYPSAVTDPTGPAIGRGHVLRGGSFNSQGLTTRSSDRTDNSPANRHIGDGFRLAKTK